MGGHLSSVSSRTGMVESSSDESEIQKNGFLQIRSTHDVSLVEHHIPHMAKFVADLQEAVDAIRLAPNGGRYKEVHVFFLSWENDSLGVQGEIDELRSIFLKLYRFEIHEYKIRGDKPGRDTQSKVATFLQGNDHSDHLLILYYAGHAMPSRQGSEAPIWAATDKSDTPTVSAGGIQALFEEADSDVLLLYDCCYSAHPAVTNSGYGHGVTEVIAASGFESQAPGIGRNSFTHALIQALTQACQGQPFSAAKLHEMVLRSLKSHTRDHLRDERGEIWTDPHGRPILQRHPSSTPIHCFLTEDRPHRGIILAPLPLKISDSAGIGTSGSSSTLSSIPLGNNNTSTSNPSSALATDILDPRSSETTNVLLSIRLEKDYFEGEMSENIRVWREWIRNMPQEAKNIQVEAIYESFSTLVLFTMPVTLWNLLPNNLAYSFVGFTTSDNKVSAFQELNLDEKQEKSDSQAPSVLNRIMPGIQMPPHSDATDDKAAVRASVQKGVEITNMAMGEHHIFSNQQTTKTAHQPDHLVDPGDQLPTPVPDSKERAPVEVIHEIPKFHQQTNATAGWPLTGFFPPQSKAGWSAFDLVERAKIVRQLLRQIPEEQAHLKIAKLTFLYNIKIIIPGLRSLREIEYLLLRDANVGDDYLNTLDRCASLLQWPLILTQVIMVSIPRRPTPLMWASLTQSLLLDEELSLRPEQEEAETLRIELSQYLEIANNMLSTGQRR